MRFNRINRPKENHFLFTTPSAIHCLTSFEKWRINSLLYLEVNRL